MVDRAVRRRAKENPTRFVVVTYLGAAVVGTVLLALPVSVAQPGRAPVTTALFSSVSAISITGLSTVDIGSYYSVFGQVVLLVLIQFGGIGIVTLGTLAALLIRSRLRLRDQMAAQWEARTLSVGQVRGLLLRIGKLFLLMDVFTITVLVLRMRFGYHEQWPTALWHGLFHGVSGANSAGLSLYANGMARFVGDVWVIGAFAIVAFVGALGYPVLFELRERGWHPGRWSAHARMTVWGMVGLLVIGVITFGVFEWNNPETLGGLPVHDRITATLAGGVFPSSAGFNTVDYAHLSDETMMVQLGQMFIGGGSAGTAGGIKITTFLVLAAVMGSELRGEPDVTVAHRRIPQDVQRQALTIALAGVACVALGVIALTLMTDQPLELILFEAVSAFATVGLSADLTGDLPVSAQMVLVLLMFIGRVGTITFATSLALKQRHRRYRLADERPLVG